MARTCTLHRLGGLLTPLLLAAIAGACWQSSDSSGPDLTALPAPPVAGNQGTVEGVPTTDDPSVVCPPAQANETLPPREAPTFIEPTATFDHLRDTVVSLCGSCHMDPAATGGFRFSATRLDQVREVGGVRETVPGLKSLASTMARAIATDSMPPGRPGSKDEAVRELGALLTAWLSADSPEGSFPVPSLRNRVFPKTPLSTPSGMTAVGQCIPQASAVGRDSNRDTFFEGSEALPALLSETDLSSLDALTLARHGTFAYAPAYPLWSDDAKKLRHVHVPTKGDKTGSKPQGIRFDAKAKRFEIPDNTRFYKTFLKEVRTATGSLAYRKIETRIIVVRTPWEKSLFGSYRWNDSETEATLVTQPYRNGQPFKDTIFPIEVDETTHAMKSYAIPAKHRCVECHQGAEGRNFVLGFTPLQVRRRDAGTGGTDGTHGPLGPDERNQVRRFLDYGVLEGIRSEDDLPALEDALDRPSDGVQGNAGVATETAPRRPTPWALDAQAYLLGNCAHCHNPEGFATRQDNRLASFDLRAGKLFEFPVATRGVSSGNLLVSAGNPAGSELYQRVANPTQLQGIVALQHMPLHTPSIDCQAVDRIGRWIASIPMDPGSKAPPEEREKARVDAEQRAKAFDAQCKPGQSLPWVDEDFTELSPYHPRRGDWQDPTTGIPPALRALDLSKEVEELARTPIATGYWNKNDACAFPSVDKPEGGVRPWMVDRQGKPKRPYGEVYFQTAGSHFFSSVCQKCHGPKANGDSGIAKLLSAQTGGTVRVANLMDGLFGDKGSNLSLFSVREGGQSRNLAGNYFIWMASGGTKVPFPPGFSELVGSYGGNMLSRIRDQFARLLPGHRNPMAEYYQTYDVYARVATLGNPMPSDAGYATNGTPLNEPIQRAWLDRAQGNAGWVLFQFFRNEAASGQFPLSPNDCQKAFAKTP